MIFVKSLTQAYITTFWLLIQHQDHLKLYYMFRWLNITKKTKWYKHELFQKHIHKVKFYPTDWWFDRSIGCDACDTYHVYQNKLHTLTTNMAFTSFQTELSCLWNFAGITHKIHRRRTNLTGIQCYFIIGHSPYLYLYASVILFIFHNHHQNDFNW